MTTVFASIAMLVTAWIAAPGGSEGFGKTIVRVRDHAGGITRTGKAHMLRILFALVLATNLAGCSRWDEAAERAACGRSHPADKAASDQCYAKNKLAYDSAFAQMWRQR